MNEAILDDHPREELFASGLPPACLGELPASLETQHDLTSSGNRCHAETRLHTQKILDLKIEYIPSPKFSLPDAADFILLPMPVVDNNRSGSGKTLPKAPDDTPPYLAALYSIPLLTREQECHLFLKMNYLKYRADKLRYELDSDQPNVALHDQIEAFLSQSLAVRNQIVQANLRLVVSIAKMFVDVANSFDDLVSDGNVPLVRAAEIFDIERGTRFSTYATWAVRNSLYRSTQRSRRIRSRYRTDNHEGFESVQEHRQSHRAQESYHFELRKSLKVMLCELDDRDRIVVVSRFGLNGNKRPLKFREIAERLNISTERVRQLLARSLKKLEKIAELSSIELEC